MNVFGTTRSSIQANHALITPDTHVRSPLLEWKNAEAIIHISPQMGARFMQYTALLKSGSQSGFLRASIQRFAFVVAGQVELVDDDGHVDSTLDPGSYVYFPPGSKWTLRSHVDAELEVFEKLYVPLPDIPFPELLSGHASEVNSEAFMDDEDAQLKILLPKHASFDMAVNLFTFQPGATLPMVEVHVMEHGFRLMDGAGVYRLGECYYPIKAGDVIWMGPYCPQWWVAMGKTPSTYLYYKDVHRDSLEDLL